MSKLHLTKKQIRFSVNSNLTPSQRENLDNIPDFKIPQEIQKLLSQYSIKALEKPLPQTFFRIRPQPKLLYFLGNLDLLNKKTIGIVGPRKPTNEGKLIVNKIFEILKSYDIATISGLAIGIDSLTHQLSIENSIPTIAILGGGIGFFLKSKSRDKILNILKNGGLIISEFKLFFEPTKYTFPQRNRIIAGLSDILFLPQASLNSGSLITAEFAQKFKTPLYCVPGSIFDDNFRGTNELISNSKAIMISDLKNIPKLWDLKTLSNSISIDEKHSDYQLSELQSQIIQLLKKEPLSTNQIASKLNMPVFKILVEITQLEISNHIFNQSGQRKINT